MNELTAHLAPSMWVALMHVLETGHTDIWFHRRSLKDHELVCMSDEHGGTWENWVDFHRECDLRRHP